jgi:hypothetical protein
VSRGDIRAKQLEHDILKMIALANGFRIASSTSEDTKVSPRVSSSFTKAAQSVSTNGNTALRRLPVLSVDENPLNGIIAYRKRLSSPKLEQAVKP